MAIPVLANESDIIANVLVDSNQHAFSVLVKHYQQSIRQYCRRLCAPDDAMGDDIAQETFLQAYRKLSSYAGKGKFSSWLFSIAYYQFLQTLRSKKHYDELPEEIAFEGHSHKVEQDRDLEGAMAVLTPQERACITLQFSFGYTQEEITQVLSLPLGTVKSHIRRGKEKLTEALRLPQSPEPLTGAA